MSEMLLRYTLIPPLELETPRLELTFTAAAPPE